MNLRYFEGSVEFVQKVKFTKPNYHIDAYLEYGACNDQNCMPPTSVDIKKSGKSPAVAEDAKQDAKDAAADAADVPVGDDAAATATGAQGADSVNADSLAAANAARAALFPRATRMPFGSQ